MPGITGVTLDQPAKTSLLTLIAWKCAIIDEGVAKISQLLGLTLLDIQSHAGVTNAAIPHLRSLPALNRLFIAGTGITP